MADDDTDLAMAAMGTQGAKLVREQAKERADLVQAHHDEQMQMQAKVFGQGGVYDTSTPPPPPDSSGGGGTGAGAGEGAATGVGMGGAAGAGAGGESGASMGGQAGAGAAGET